MGLRDKVTLLFICVMFYQSSCMPRRCKNNYAYKSRNPSPKYGKQINRSPAKIVYNNVAQTSPVLKLRCEGPKYVPERIYDVPKLCQNQKSQPEPVNKDCKKTPVTEWNWEVPEVPDFEDNLDLFKQCLTPAPRPTCNTCKCGSCTAFDPFPEPFCFKEKGSFPEIDYPLDVNDFRIPNYWNDFIEEKLKQQGEEIDQACTKLYQGKSKTSPLPKNKAIEKAVNALLKSQVKKSATASEPSRSPVEDVMDQTQLKNTPINDKVTNMVEYPITDVISNPTEDVKSTQKKEQTIFHKTVSTPPQNFATTPVEDVYKPIENDPGSMSECSENSCPTTCDPLSKSVDTPASGNPEQNILPPDEVSGINPDSIVPPLDGLLTESELSQIDESGVKKLLIDSLLAISNMNASQKETLETMNPSTQNTLAVGEDDFGFATLSPIDEEAPRVVRSCSNDPSLYLCPEDLDYMIMSI